ncbi:MAG: O-methyltransferase, partial [Erysipelotrichaceae bacterium]
GIFIFDNLEFHGMVHHIDEITNRHTRQLVRKIKTFQDLILEDERFEACYHADIGDGVLILKKRGNDNEN